MTKLLWGMLALLVPPACTVALGLGTLHHMQVGAIQDDAWYINTASALARGMGYVRAWTPAQSPETGLPVGYPLILAPLRWLFPDSFTPVQLLSLAATSATVLISLWYYRRQLEPAVAWLAAVCLAVNVGMVFYSNVVMTEAVYGLLTLSVIVLVWREERRNESNAWVYVLIGLLATAAYFVRAWGVTLVGALCIYFALRRRWSGLAATLAPFMVTSLIWSMRNASLGGAGVSYGLTPETLAPMLQKLTRNWPATFAEHWLRDLPRWFYTPRTTFVLEYHHLSWLEPVLQVIILALVVAGFLAHVRKGVSLADVYVLAYAAVISVAPPADRYWAPLLPLLLLYLIWGVQALVTVVPHPAARRYATAVVILLLLSLCVLHVRRDLQDVSDPPRRRMPDVALGSTWLAANTPNDAIVMQATPVIGYLYSGRRAVPFPDTRGQIEDPYGGLTAGDKRGRLVEAIELFQVRYVLVEPASVTAWSEHVQQVVVPALEADSARFRQVFSANNGLVRVYQVQRQP